MYVCICKSVTDRDIRKAATSGVTTLDELRAELGVASGCGTCAESAANVLAEATTHTLVPVRYAPTAA